MTEDEYNEQDKAYDQQIDDFWSNLSTERSKLENDYDLQKKDIQRQIDENNQALDIYRSRGQEGIDFMEYLHSTRNDIMLGKDDYLSDSNKVHNLFQQKLDYFRKINNQLEQEQAEAKTEFQRRDEQLQMDCSNNVHAIQSKKDDLKDEYYSQDEGW